MTMDDLRSISKILFVKNDKKALMDRTLLAKQWLAIGRSSDVGFIYFSDLHWHDHFILIDITRYAFLTVAFTRAVSSSDSHVSAYINRLLKSLYEFDQDASGGAAFASADPSVNLSDLAHRGLRRMDGFAILLEYISPTSSGDQNIPKVLGGLVGY
jgi:hypothetical protein